MKNQNPKILTQYSHQSTIFLKNRKSKCKSKHNIKNSKTLKIV